MKIYLIGLACAFSLMLNAQTTINESYPVKPGTEVKLKFDFPKIKVSTWDKNEVSISAVVNINNGENDNAFKLEHISENNTFVLSGTVKDMEKLPHHYTIVKDGQKIFFKTEEEFLKAKKNGGIDHYNEGSDIDIVVEIRVPAQSVTDIKSIYGIVEVSNFNAPVTIDATYGGIDASLDINHTGKLKVTTQFGQIYTNLDLHLTDHTDKDFFHSITADSGKGPNYILTSNFGKIYLRKS